MSSNGYSNCPMTATTRSPLTRRRSRCIDTDATMSQPTSITERAAPAGRPKCEGLRVVEERILVVEDVSVEPVSAEKAAADAQEDAGIAAGRRVAPREDGTDTTGSDGSSQRIWLRRSFLDRMPRERKGTASDAVAEPHRDIVCRVDTPAETNPARECGQRVQP